LQSVPDEVPQSDRGTHGNTELPHLWEDFAKLAGAYLPLVGVVSVAQARTIFAQAEQS
jgi:hypothetical protein